VGEAEKTPPSTPLGMLLSSGTKGDLLILFHRNPGLMDTIDGIARRMGKRAPDIAPEISELTGVAILHKKAVGRSEVYFLNRQRDEQIKGEIAAYITGLGKKQP